MKKLFLMAAMMVASVAASAQIYVGGGIGFNSSKADYEGAEAATSFKITPEIGYNLDENWTVGIGLGYAHSKQGEIKSDAFSIEPYARYTFVKWNNVGLFAEAGVGYAHTKDTKTLAEEGGNELNAESKYDIFSIGIRPGVSIALNDKLTFVTKIGWLGYTNEKAGDIKTNSFGFDFDTINDIDFALYFNF